MGTLYIQEPPTSGKVVLKTTVGDIDIELWSKETPKACRNFIQLCVEKYYDGTAFHRVVKGFIAQGGDPKGDGSGGESIYGKPFKDEFHSRLRFVRRGLVAMANGGPDDNGSQFFFTLGACPELQNKNTIFGKVSGATLFNMLKIEECLVDKNDKPLYSHKIISAEVLMNPFDDMVPRKKEELIKFEAIKSEPKKQKNYKLLSFGEEAEEEETEVQSVITAFKGKSKSMHDLINDPKLSSVSAAALYKKDDDDNVNEAAERLVQVKKKLKTDKSELKGDIPKPSDKIPNENESDNEETISEERKKIQEEIKMLTKEIRKKPKKNENELTTKEIELENDEEHISNPLVAEFREQQKKFKSKIKEIPKDKAEREKKTMELLNKFEQKLKNAHEMVENEEDDDDEDDLTWMAHTLKCGEQTIIAKDANIKSNDWYDITDPRNSINQRKRQEKKK